MSQANNVKQQDVELRKKSKILEKYRRMSWLARSNSLVEISDEEKNDKGGEKKDDCFIREKRLNN